MALKEFLKVGINEYKTKSLISSYSLGNVHRSDHQSHGFNITADSRDHENSLNIPFLSQNLTGLVQSHLNITFIKANGILRNLDSFFTKRLLRQLENTDGQDYNFGTRAYDDVFFQPVDGNLRKPYFDMNEISLQFCENGLPRAGGVTLMSGCFYFNNISKLLECRNDLYEQVFKTSSFFLSTGLSRTPLSGFPTPDGENLVRFVVGQRSNRQKDSTWVWPPNQKGFGYADPTLTELLNMFSNDEGA